MVAGRVPGPLGLNDYGVDSAIGRARIGPHAPRGAAPPGPLGFHGYADPNGGSGGQAATGSTKPRALIVIGAGQDELKRAHGRDGTDANLDAAARAAFKPYVKDSDVTIRHVRNSAEMKAVIVSQNWDIVVYFGHGFVNARSLSPAHNGNDELTESDLANALNTAHAKKVYLIGCSAADTGLARSLSTDLPGTSVYGMLNELEAKWEMNKSKSVNNLTFGEQPTEYTNGKRTVDGQPTATRPRDRLDGISTDDSSGEIKQ
jgi:hypothetical protein